MKNGISQQGPDGMISWSRLRNCLECVRNSNRASICRSDHRKHRGRNTQTTKGAAQRGPIGVSKAEAEAILSETAVHLPETEALMKDTSAKRMETIHVHGCGSDPNGLASCAWTRGAMEITH